MGSHCRSLRRLVLIGWWQTFAVSMKRYVWAHSGRSAPRLCLDLARPTSGSPSPDRTDNALSAPGADHDLPPMGNAREATYERRSPQRGTSLRRPANN